MPLYTFVRKKLKGPPLYLVLILEDRSFPGANLMRCNRANTQPLVLGPSGIPASPLQTSLESIRLVRLELANLTDDCAIRVVAFVRYLVDQAEISGFSLRGRGPMKFPTPGAHLFTRWCYFISRPR